MIFRSQGSCGRQTAGSPETILKRRKWQEENCDLRAKEAVKSKVVFKMKKA